MSKKKDNGSYLEELQICEPDELGWEVVFKDGELYEKKTLILDNCIARVYMPIPFRKKESK